MEATNEPFHRISRNPLRSSFSSFKLPISSPIDWISYNRVNEMRTLSATTAGGLQPPESAINQLHLSLLCTSLALQIAVPSRDSSRVSEWMDVSFDFHRKVERIVHLFQSPFSLNSLIREVA